MALKVEINQNEALYDLSWAYEPNRKSTKNYMCAMLSPFWRLRKVNLLSVQMNLS